MTHIEERLGSQTDKFSLGYFPAYAALAEEIGPAGRVLEVGVADGGSLQLWQELFPDGLVAGVDCDERAVWPAGTKTILAAQDSPSMAEAAHSLSPDGYDLIVDDASHVGSLTEATFKLLWPLVVPGGWYVVEDWPVAYLEPWARTDRFEGDAMLRLVQSFVPQLEPQAGALDYRGHRAPETGSDIGELWYRFGQAMLHKRGGRE